MELALIGETVATSSAKPSSPVYGVLSLKFKQSQLDESECHFTVSLVISQRQQIKMYSNGPAYHCKY